MSTSQLFVDVTEPVAEYFGNSVRDLLEKSDEGNYRFIIQLFVGFYKNSE